MNEAKEAKEEKAIKETVQQKLYEISGKDTVVLNFKKDSVQLSEAEISELKTTLAAVKEDSKVKEILILAYADQPYPHDQKSDLNKSARKLAQKRGNVVKEKISSFGGKNIKVYNMATKANWFEKALVTSTAQVKQEAVKSPANQDADDAFYQALGKHLVAQGGPGKVVVVMRRDFSYSH
ncbi:MAG: hypothetical protein NTX25_21235 [Proteobacteria bacterium]|nr:hypothetical protein [Pseudomonadota bacterium]